MLLRGTAVMAGQESQRCVLYDRVAQVAVAIGRPEPAWLQEAVEGCGGNPTIICEPEWGQEVADRLGTGTLSPATYHVLRHDRGLPERLPHPVRPVSRRDHDTLIELPWDLRQQLREAFDRGPVLAALCQGRPVSFCSIGWFTETLRDLAVDTLAGHRGRGYGVACLTAMVRGLLPAELLPVGIIEDDNSASRRLVGRLGFEQAGASVLWRGAEQSD